MRAKGLTGLQMGALAPVLIIDCICVLNFEMFFGMFVLTNFLSSIFRVDFTITIGITGEFLIMLFHQSEGQTMIG